MAALAVILLFSAKLKASVQHGCLFLCKVQALFDPWGDPQASNSCGSKFGLESHSLFVEGVDKHNCFEKEAGANPVKDSNYF